MKGGDSDSDAMEVDSHTNELGEYTRCVHGSMCVRIMSLCMCSVCLCVYMCHVSAHTGWQWF